MATIEKRTYPSGLVGYRVLIRRHNFPFMSKTFRSLEAAKIWANKVEAYIDLKRAEKFLG